MNSLLKERKIQPENVRILTADLGLIGVNQISAIIFPMVVWKEGVGMKEESCGT